MAIFSVNPFECRAKTCWPTHLQRAAADNIVIAMPPRPHLPKGQKGLPFPAQPACLPYAKPKISTKMQLQKSVWHFNGKHRAKGTRANQDRLEWTTRVLGTGTNLSLLQPSCSLLAWPDTCWKFKFMPRLAVFFCFYLVSVFQRCLHVPGHTHSHTHIFSSRLPTRSDYICHLASP